jgi:GntR family transcriptional regulator/MocR family aminotransferase
VRPWTFPVALDPEAREPLFQQIIRAITEDIRRGRLRPGTRLPGSRTLAEHLGVHRNTILAAFRELAAEGWIEGGAHQTCVAEDLPTGLTPRRASTTGGLGFDLGDPLPGPEYPSLRTGALDLAGGLPDPRLVPVEELGRAMRRALHAKPSPLPYGDAQGEPRLRAALATLLGEVRGLACSAEQVLVTGGSQMALDLIARSLVRPGDRVAVENPGYPPAWRTFAAAGATLVPLPVDEGGLSVEALEQALRDGPIRALYLTPHHQFPTTVTLTAPRRLRLQELARRHRMAVIEDDYDFEFHFEGRPVLPLASADPAGVVIYLGTLSKVLAPTLRLGFVVAPTPLIDALSARRLLVDHHGNRIMERAVAELIEDGLLQRHARKVRRIYAERREILLSLLERYLGDVLTLQPAAGGLSMWTHTAPRIDAAAWSARALAAGVLVMPGQRFDAKGRNLPRLRVGFSALDPKELREAVKRLKDAL